MEALGTPLGGGALKLEASHLRQLLIPVLSIDARNQLHRLGADLKQTSHDALQEIDSVIFDALSPGRMRCSPSIAIKMMERADALRRMRRRVAA